MRPFSIRSAIVTAFVLASCLIAVPLANAMTAEPIQDRAVATAELRSASKPQPREFDRVPPASSLERGCQLSCVKRTLNALINRHNQLVDAYNALAFDFYECETLTPVTQYFGYDYNGYAAATTALDITATGDAPSRYMVNYVC